MFNPSQHEVRRFFFEVHAKRGRSAPLTPLESIAAHWIEEHPEYHRVLAQCEETLSQRFDGADGQGNPFLHLSMHLAISEQLSIDQPPGIRALFEQLTVRFGSSHEAAHQVMECLGEVLWHAQRSGQMPNGEAYIDCLRRRA